MNIEQAMKMMGEFGWYQRILYGLLCLPLVSVGMHNVNSALLLFIPKHRCRIPGYVNDTYEIQGPDHAQLINFTVPPDEHHTYSKCTMYVHNESDPSYIVEENKMLVKCSSWVYDKSVFTSTFISQYNIVCTEDEFIVAYMQMVSYIGDTVGALSMGIVSDIIGRKKTLCMSMLLLLVSTIGLSWAPNKAGFMAIKFLSGIASSGVYLSSFVLGMELVGPSQRMFAGMLINFYYALGIMLLGAVGYWLRDWFWIEIVNAVPVVLFLFFCWFVPESPRWLIVKGKHQEATQIVNKIAKFNGTDTCLLPEKDKEEIDDKPPGDTDKIWHLFSSCVMLRRSVVIFFNWFAVSLGYFGLSLSTSNWKGDFYLNVFLSGLSEIPAYIFCLFCLDRIGRKKVYVSTVTLGGVALICTIFPTLYAGEDLQAITVAFTLIGNFGIAAAYATIFIWSAEVFPTAVRNSGIGASSTFSCLGLIVCPFIANLNQGIEGDLGQSSPLIVIGVTALIGGLFSFSLPETKDTDLSDTVIQTEHRYESIP